MPKKTTPPAVDKAKHSVFVRLTTEEFQWLQAFAAREHRSNSGVLRHMIRTEMEREQ